MKVLQVGFGAALLFGLVPLATAIHTTPGDWTCGPQWAHSFPEYPDCQPRVYDEILRVYPESDGSKAFLSLGQEKAGSADWHAFADIPSGAPSHVASLQSGMLRPAWTIRAKEPLAFDHFLNLSRAVRGTLYWSNTVTASGGARGADYAVVRIEVFADDKRVGGYEDIHHLGVGSSAWTWISISIWPEIRVLEQGQTLSFKVSRSGGAGDFLLGTGDGHQSFIEFKFQRQDPLGDTYYMDQGKLTPFVPEEEAKDAAPARVGPGVLAAGLVATSLAHGTRVRRLLPTALVLALFFAGCVSGPPAAPASSDTAARPTGEISYENSSGLGGRGSLRGVVRDDVGFAISGAHLVLVGTNRFADADAAGRYEMENLTAATYEIRVQAQSYPVYEASLTVLADRITWLNITLSSGKGRAEADGRPHVHGPWGAGDVAELQTFSFPYQGCPTAVTRRECDVPITTFDYAKPIPPGTGRVEVVLRWDGSPLGAPKELGLRVVTNMPRYQIFFNGGGLACGCYQSYVARPQNEPIHIVIYPNEADPGHQQFTNWQFFLRSAAFDLAGPTRVPEFVETRVEGTVLAHRGVVPYEPPHRDLWNGSREIVLVGGKAITEQSAYQATGSAPGMRTWMPAPGAFVPSGATEIRGFFEWSGSVQLDQWGLLYKAANSPAAKPVWKPVELVGFGNNRSFTIPVDADEVDPFYATTSGFRFSVGPAGDGPHLAYGTTWKLFAVVVREPADGPSA